MFPNSQTMGSQLCPCPMDLTSPSCFAPHLHGPKLHYILSCTALDSTSEPSSLMTAASSKGWRSHRTALPLCAAYSPALVDSVHYTVVDLLLGHVLSSWGEAVLSEHHPPASFDSPDGWILGHALTERNELERGFCASRCKCPDLGAE